jgi:hypothetical protein
MPDFQVYFDPDGVVELKSNQGIGASRGYRVEGIGRTYLPRVDMDMV